MARKRLYNILFVVETSRIARKMADAIQIIDLFRSQGIKVATPSKVYDFTNYNDSFMAHITSSIDELERQRIKERSERGRRKAAESGNYIGQELLYGYTTSKIEIPGQKRECTKIVFDEEQKQGLLKIVELYEAGLSGREIADELTRLGYKTKTGNAKWDKSVPIEILKNRWLYGEATAFRKVSYKDKGKRIYIPQNEETWIKFEVPALITKERWLAIQEKMKSRTLKTAKQTRYSEKNDWYLFRDLLTCGNCLEELTKRNQLDRSARIGHRADFYIHTQKNGKSIKEARYPYYVCVGRARHLREWACSLPQIRSTTLDDMLWQETVKIISNPSIIYDAVTHSQKETIEKKKIQEDKISKKTRELEEKKAQRNKVVKNFLTSDFIKEDDYKNIIKEIDDGIAKIELEITELKNTEITDPKGSVSLESIAQVCKELSNSIEKYDFNMKRKVIEALYEQIIVGLDWSVTLQGKIPLTPQGIDFLHDRFSNYQSTQHLADASFQVRFC
jgi:DNA invertase Pin-like site-specific DNA recombinase